MAWVVLAARDALVLLASLFERTFVFIDAGIHPDGGPGAPWFPLFLPTIVHALIGLLLFVGPVRMLRGITRRRTPTA